MFKQIAPYIGPLIIVLLLAWRMSRAMKGRPIRPSQLWIRPVFVAVFLLIVLATSPLPSPLWLAIYVLAAGLGLGAGYLLARHQTLSLDPASGKIISKTSPIGVILFVGLFAGRYAFRYYTNGGQMPDKVAAHSAQITLSTDAALLFLFALVAAQAWEIRHRAKPLVAERAAAKLAKQAGE